jgi:hypothetical protein
MASSSGPDSFNAAYHGRLTQITRANPANQATAITAYFIFLRGGILDQVLAMLFPVYLTYLFALQHHFDLCLDVCINIAVFKRRRPCSHFSRSCLPEQM